MEYDSAELRTAVERAVSGAPPTPDLAGATPVYYVVGGSHLYGFPSEEGGDVDVRGFHVVPIERHALIDRPVEQVEINQGGITAGYEEFADVDMVSYECREFGRLLYEASFNALEVAFAEEPILDAVPDAMADLRDTVERHLPLDVPQSYAGMARSTHDRYLDPCRASYHPTAKNFLYVYRGLLGALYVERAGSIEPDVRELARSVAEGDPELVADLIEVKRTRERAEVGKRLADRARTAVDDLFDVVDPREVLEKDAYRAAIDDWMLSVRAATPE